MQQPPQPRTDGLRGAFRPQHGRNRVTSDRALRLGKVNQQRKALAQRQRAHPVVTPNLRESERPDA